VIYRFIAAELTLALLRAYSTNITLAKVETTSVP
jgi:hypothetical protein